MDIESTLSSKLQLDEKTRKQLDKRIASFVHVILSMDVRSEKFHHYVDAIHTLGVKDMRKAAEVSRRMIDFSAGTLKVESSNSQKIIRLLDQLRSSIRELDPSHQGDLLSPKKLFGFIPVSAKSKLVAYFKKYESTQHDLDTLIEMLLKAQDGLHRDISNLDIEQEKLASLMSTLKGHIYVTEQSEQFLSDSISKIQVSEADKAQLITNNLIPDLQQKRIDLMTQAAVNRQGLLSIDLIKKNNSDLIKGIERSTTTTIAALHTAMIVAVSVSGQKLILNKINALNRSANDAMEVSKEVIKDQKNNKLDIDKANEELRTLKTCFDDIYITLEDVRTKQESNIEKIQHAVQKN